MGRALLWLPVMHVDSIKNESLKFKRYISFIGFRVSVSCFVVQYQGVADKVEAVGVM
jgi:hypothetical protein